MGKTLFKEEWISIKENNGYCYLHEEKCNGTLVAILLTRNFHNEKQYLMREEICPAHGNKHEFCGIIGGYDNDSISLFETAIKEIKEETGYTVNISKLLLLGWVWDAKIADTKVYLFTADVSKLIPGIPTTDGTELEKNSYCKWVNLDQCMLTNDSKVHVILNKLRYMEDIKK